ncbi:MAG TPA: hypothetical protein VFE23_10575 [Usitatibacter sp.]|jgi:hypothetical protein|nr:hypothetical protein [Usitatibacter sp.]
MGQRFERWYAQYWAQSWYRNTYLVRHPRQIAREIRGERDWNNVYDAGCNFTCLAMMLGIDPARLASELAPTTFFRAERGNVGRNVAGENAPLVWDQNEPQLYTRRLELRRVWLPQLGCRATLTLRYVGQELTFEHREALAIVRAARRRREHIVTGASDHSHLVAGRADDDFYLWDPDDTEVPVERSLAGRIRLADLFRTYVGQPIEFWRYTVQRKLHRERSPPR